MDILSRIGTKLASYIYYNKDREITAGKFVKDILDIDYKNETRISFYIKSACSWNPGMIELIDVISSIIRNGGKDLYEILDENDLLGDNLLRKVTGTNVQELQFINVYDTYCLGFYRTTVLDEALALTVFSNLAASSIFSLYAPSGTGLTSFVGAFSKYMYENRDIAKKYECDPRIYVIDPDYISRVPKNAIILFEGRNYTDDPIDVDAINEVIDKCNSYGLKLLVTSYNELPGIPSSPFKLENSVRNEILTLAGKSFRSELNPKFFSENDDRSLPVGKSIGRIKSFIIESEVKHEFTPSVSIVSRRKKIDDELKSIINAEIIGHQDIVEDILKGIKMHDMGFTFGDRPRGSYMFIGPPGNGKTHMALTICNALCEKTELVQLAEHVAGSHTINALLGTAAGFIGYGQETIVDRINENPYFGMILDDINMGNDEIVTGMTMGPLERGFIVDKKGNRASCTEMLVIGTANPTIDSTRSSVGFSRQSAAVNKKKYIQSLTDKFGAPFVSRWDKIIVVPPLTNEQLVSIVHYWLSKLRIKITCDDNVAKFILDMTEESPVPPSLYGARGMRSVLVDYIEPFLANYEDSLHIVMSSDGKSLKKGE